MEMGEFFCASKSYDSTCYASAMIEMGEYCCVLATPIGFDLLRLPRLTLARISGLVNLVSRLFMSMQ